MIFLFFLFTTIMGVCLWRPNNYFIFDSICSCVVIRCPMSGGTMNFTLNATHIYAKQFKCREISTEKVLMNCIYVLEWNEYSCFRWIVPMALVDLVKLERIFFFFSGKKIRLPRNKCFEIKSSNVHLRGIFWLRVWQFNLTPKKTMRFEIPIRRAHNNRIYRANFKCIHKVIVHSPFNWKQETTYSPLTHAGCIERIKDSNATSGFRLYFSICMEKVKFEFSFLEHDQFKYYALLTNK